MAIFPLERGRSLSSRDLLPDVKLSNEQPSGKLLEKDRHSYAIWLRKLLVLSLEQSSTRFTLFNNVNSVQVGHEMNPERLHHLNEEALMKLLL